MTPWMLLCLSLLSVFSQLARLHPSRLPYCSFAQLNTCFLVLKKTGLTDSYGNPGLPNVGVWIVQN